MTNCPVDGTRMWDKDSRYLGCKFGHVMAKDAVLPAAESATRETHIVVPVPKWWQKPHFPWAFTGVLVVAQIVEVLL